MSPRKSVIWLSRGQGIVKLLFGEMITSGAAHCRGGTGHYRGDEPFRELSSFEGRAATMQPDGGCCSADKRASIAC